MAANHSHPHLFSDLWAQTYPVLTGHTQQPPAKKAKISHPAAVVCCDQPCDEDETLCFDDYCHDFCTELCQEPCQDHCQLPCAQSCDQSCADPCPEDCQLTEDHHHLQCLDTCNADCLNGCATDHCNVDCMPICTSLDTCADPATACLDNCGSWCDFHYPIDCFDCTSSPATASDVRTPQIAQSLEAVMPLIHNPYPYLPQLPIQPYTPIPTRLSTPIVSAAVAPAPVATQHICRVSGCTAGAFVNEDALQTHIEKTHLVKIKDRYVCQWEGCVKRVTKKSNDHISREKAARALGKTYIPPSEPFSDEHLHKLKRHYFVHSGKKAFECAECGSIHATKAQLKVHMARHNPKEFHCDECDKIFTTQNQLKTHTNAVHKKEKHFRCPDCDYACDDSSNMSSHKRKQHQYGVPCPSHVHGCTYRDGRQADMARHMHAHGHGAWIVDDRDAFDVYWKKEKRAAEDARLRDEQEKSAGGLLPNKKANVRGKHNTAAAQRQHQRTQSLSTVHSDVVGSGGRTTLESTPAAPELTFNHFALMSDHDFAAYPFGG